MDLAKEVSCRQMYRWSGGKWRLGEGYEERAHDEALPHVVAIDYGSKRNIFRNLADAGARVTVLPATATLRGGDGARSPTASSSPTAPAIPPRPANMPCR